VNPDSLSPAEPYSAAFCERQYDNRAAVPNHQDYFVRWVSRSTLAREKLSCYPDFAYGTGARHTLDLFPAANPNGLLVFIHGGYWRTLDKADFSFVAEPFVAHDISVAAINYGLCPAVRIDDIVQDCAHAIAWLNANTLQFGLDGKPIVVGGHSAGGHLAAMMMTIDWEALKVLPSRIAGAVSVSGVFDLEPLVHTSMNADLRLDAESARRVSPIHLQPKITAPVQLVVGGIESSEFVRQNLLLKAAWPQVSGEPAVVFGCHHFSIVEHFADPASPAFRRALKLFE
jgi:arylformamidase